MFSQSNNIKKLRELVEQLCIRDTDVFNRLEILKLTLGYTTDGYWDWTINNSLKVYENFVDNIDEEDDGPTNLNESVTKIKPPLSTKPKSENLFDFDLFFDSFTASPGLMRQLGFEDDELNTELQGCKGLANEDDLIELNTEINKHFESKGEYKFKSITRYRHKHGHTVRILSRGSVIEWDADENPVRMVGTHIDITNL